MKKLLIVLALSGVIYLGFSLVGAESYKKCIRYSGGEKQQCWKSQFEETLDSRGVNGGFDLLLNLYDNDAEFASSCHDYTHLIGDYAYRDFSNNKKVELTEVSSFCGYGFYHGFIISLLKNGGGGADAAEFCDNADNVAGLDCFHGMGHGFVDFNSSDLDSLLKVQALIDQGISLCERVTEKTEQAVRCKDGVFHSIFDTAIGDEALLSLIVPRDDPFVFCKSQTGENRSVCIGAASTLTMSVNNDDFLRSLDSVQSNLSINESKVVIRQMAGYAAYRSLQHDDLSGRANDCKSLTDGLKEECIKGLVEGVADFGNPEGQEYQIRDFCGDKIFTRDESGFCFLHAVDYFGRYFGKQKRDSLCKIVDSKYCRLSGEND